MADSGDPPALTSTPSYPLYGAVRQGNNYEPESAGRSRRSLAQVEDHPPNITPIGGVPNLKGKVVVRPIAFRPSPGRPGSSAGGAGPGQVSRPASSTLPSSPGLSSGYQTPVQTTFGPGGSVITTSSSSSSSSSGPSQPGQAPGFVPGHPLVKDGHRQFGSSQELNRSQQLPPPISSKFSSLDRRALGQRSCRGLLQGGGGQLAPVSNGLRLSTWSGYDGGSSTSLPPVGLTPPTTTTAPPQREREPVRSSKEPERRHSLYDSASRGRGTASSNTGSSSSNSGAISAMNVNGLPEPFGPPLSRPPSSSTIHSLHQEPRTRHSGAGTPQFRSLAGTGGSVVFSGPRPGRGSLSNLSTTQGNNGFIQRSVSGNNLYIEDSDTLGLHNRETSFKGSTSTIDQEYNSTPSPSDSAVGDLETVLKEKDNEIIYLRETMEQNEQVIFKVYEEKERVWERELRKIKGLYENRLKANQQKASKMEQALMNQTLQVQNEKRKLEAELEVIQKTKAELSKETNSLESELCSLRKMFDFQMDGTGISGRESDSMIKPISKVGEMMVQVGEIRRYLEVRTAECEDLKADNKVMQDEIINLQTLLDLDNEECKLKEISAQKEVIIDRDKTIEELQRSLKEADISNEILAGEVDQFKQNFEVEKANWLDEKEKVIRYQKQLQLNYVQMYKRNKTLESEVDQLKKSLAESSQKQSQPSTKSRLFSKFSKFHESQC